MQLYFPVLCILLVLLIPGFCEADTDPGIDNITLSRATLTNTTLTVDLIVFNDGSKAYETQYLALYLCDEKGNTKEARFVSWTLAPPLAPKEQEDMVLSAPIPPGLQPGSYFVYAVSSPTDTFPGPVPGDVYDAKRVEIFDYTKNLPILTDGYSVSASMAGFGNESGVTITNVSILDEKERFIPGDEIAIAVTLTGTVSPADLQAIPITAWLGNYALVPKKAVVPVPSSLEQVSFTLTYMIPDALMPGEYTLSSAPGTVGSGTGSLAKTDPVLLYKPSERQIPAFCGADALNYKMVSVTDVS